MEGGKEIIRQCYRMKILLSTYRNVVGIDVVRSFLTFYWC